MELIRKTKPEKNIAQSILDILIDYDSDIKKYNNAIDDFNDLGGIDAIAKIMEWDETQQKNWEYKIQNVYNIK